ncbi:MAG: RRXRR domain-containing protein [Clostridiales bacterium]|nr:RRXRR domain-containing protein [Clostridiales bacterium]
MKAQSKSALSLGAIKKRPIARRNRKTRCRKPRFSNRIRSKHMGWLAPSIENKIQTHIKTATNVHKMLPTAKIVVEAASFDIQKIKNPDIYLYCFSYKPL